MTRDTVYREIPPAPALARYISCFWTFRTTADEHEGLVVPDGCIDLIVDRSPSSPRVVVVGATKRPIVNRRKELVGVRFVPGCASEFLGVPASEVTDARCGLTDLWPQRGPRFAEHVAELDTSAGILEFLRAFLSREARRVRIDPRISRLVARMGSSRSSVAAMSAELGLTRQHLGRLFHRFVGLSPTDYRRVARFQSALRALRSDPSGNLAWLAQRVGYHDQAHMTRDFKVLSGHTPAASRRRLG